MHGYWDARLPAAAEATVQGQRFTPMIADAVFKALVGPLEGAFRSASGTPVLPWKPNV